MSNRKPLVPLSAFITAEGAKSILTMPFAGLPWQSQLATNKRYQRLYVQGTEVFAPNGYPATKSELRELSARLIAGCSPREITFSPNTTGALNTLIGCMVMEDLRPDENVVVPNSAYSTISLGVSRLERLGVEMRLCGQATEEICAAIDEKTRLVAIDACLYVSGELREMEKIAEAAHAVKARIIVDVSQAAGVIPLDLTHFDALFGTTGKWLGLGSNGVALCWVNRNRWPNITPEALGWYSVLPFDLPFTGEYELRSDGQRLETGGLPWPLLYNLRDALHNLIGLYERLGEGDMRLGQTKVMQHVRGLGDEIISALDDLNLGLTILSPRDAEKRGGYISVKMSDEQAVTVCSRLNAQGVYLSSGQGRLRLGPWIFNGSEDVRLAVKMLGETLREMGFNPNDPAWVGRQ
jgi:selenocysteine lyase/cysteine desulfurase